MKSADERLLRDILVQPTAPFHEHAVRTAIEAAAKRLQLPVERDAYGNVYVTYRAGRAQPLAFTAHMDHPGFEVIVAAPKPRALLLGGVAPEMMHGAPVVFQPRTRGAKPVRGRIAAVHVKAIRGARRPRVTVELELAKAVAVGDFGHFDFGGYEVRAGQLFSKALDNVLSCAVILACMAQLRRRKAAANLVGVFTRAEEVGFLGAGGVLRSRVLTASRPLVVLECSKAQGDVHMGAGPVLRVGDRMTAFDPEMDLWMNDCAADLVKHKRSFAYQRALMTGGACEASLYMLHKRRTGALATPLGNYHNMTPERGIGPEFIDQRDVDGLLLLLEHLATHPPSTRTRTAHRNELDKVFRREGSRLLAS